MHELSLTENLVRVLQEQSVAQNFERVLSVHLEIGALSTLEPGSLEFCFEIVARGTIAENAKLEILRTPGVAICRKCNTRNELCAYGEACKQCESFELEVIAGKDMTIKNVEVV